MQKALLGFIRINEICDLLGVSRSTIWRWIQAGKFPPSRKFVKGGNAVGWREDEIGQWLASRPIRSEE